jgi:hypothetical protein
MAEIQYVRIISKSGTGAPTIPPSLSHDNGDWDANDIYENELYLDNSTGRVYTRVGSTIIDLTGSGGSQDLQSVTDEGNTTSNPIQVTAGINEYGYVSGIDIGSENTFAGTYTRIENTGRIRLKAGAEESVIQNTGVTNSGVILEFPNKTSGSYVVATLEDIREYFHLDFTPSSVVTGTTSETQVGVVEIPANSIKSIDQLKIYTPHIKSGGAGTVTITYKLTTSSTLPSGTTDRIATFTSSFANFWLPMRRNPTYNSGDISIIAQSGSVISDFGATNGAPSVIAYDRTQILRLFVSVQLSNSADSVYLAGGYITNL